MGPWADEDAAKALMLKKSGLTWRQVGEFFGKSKSATQAAVSRYTGNSSYPRGDRDLNGPPIGLTMECVRIGKDARVGSQILREACMDLFCRTANLRHIPLEDAMACHLGYHAKPVVPGCERVLRGQGAMRKLAA